MVNFKIEGINEVEKTIRRMGNLPQKCVTTAAKRGAIIARNFAKKKAPYETGALESGIILKGEKTRTKGKKVYQVVMDASKNDIFVKTSKSGKRAYYPASQEYGFRTKNGGYVPGFHYLKRSLEDNYRPIQVKMVKVLSDQIDKLK
ncbi:MAG: hypothetical protein ACRC7N_07070 [Clostridium sp.]